MRTYRLVYPLIALLLFCMTATAETLQGRVVKVTDGDTFTLLDSSNKQIRVRLYGIDAPEVTGGQPFSRQSREYLASLVADKQVNVWVEEYDRYGRALGIVSTADCKDVNLMMIEAGMAWHYSHYDRTPAYIQAQKEARRQHKGLWTEKNPVNPYEWRKKNK